MMEDLFKVVKNRVKPEISTDKKSKVNIPSDLLFKCPRCQDVMFNEDFIANDNVCPKCGYHARITAQKRLELTVDKGSFIEYDAELESVNPINFPGYEEKIKTPIYNLTQIRRIKNPQLEIMVQQLENN